MSIFFPFPFQIICENVCSITASFYIGKNTGYFSSRNDISFDCISIREWYQIRNSVGWHHNLRVPAKMYLVLLRMWQNYNGTLHYILYCWQ